MRAPSEQHWLRVEALGTELRKLPPAHVAGRMEQLVAGGESSTVLALLGVWLDLPPPAAPLASGSVVSGRFTLRGKLGEGSMGTVWRARQEVIGRDVALKVIHPALVTPAFQDRFLGEIELLGQLNHPGIVRIFDAGTHEIPSQPPIPFFAMELVEGETLDRWSVSHRTEIQIQLRTAAAICSAIQNAHERRIIHRDLKPSNIMVRPDGQPVVLDFGIARLAGLAAGYESGMFSGTPQYAAPEQHLGRDQDFRSGESVDVYALGAILFEILSGRKLFRFPRGASIAEIRRIVLEDIPPRLSSVRPDCPAYLDELVARAIRRDPADRYFSMAALGRAIAHAVGLSGPAHPSPPPWKPAAGALVTGTQWRLVERLGQGSAGEIWLGIHDQMATRRVFKFCDHEDKARTLKRELSLYRLLKERIGQNPHFLQLHEVSFDEPPWYLMMEDTDARDLATWCEAQPGGLSGMAEAVKLEVGAQTAEALQAAHEAGILHRDLKPSNLLVKTSLSTGQPHVLIADFGIGQIVAEELLRPGTRLGFTHTVSNLADGTISGTLLYLAPELLEGSAATARSDIYSLGVVLWQLCIGNLHAALDPADWAARLEDPLLREDLSRCLAGAPEKRWSSAGELAARLRSLPERRTEEARRQAEIAARERLAFRRGARRTAWLAAMVILGFAALAIVAWWQWRESQRANAEAALTQAGTLTLWDLSQGRKKRGLDFLESAAAWVTNHTALRAAAARVWSACDLEEVLTVSIKSQTTSIARIPLSPRETCRCASPDGTLAAVARDLDGLNGAVDLVDVATSQRRLTLARQQFPWIPVAEPSLLSFSPDSQCLAVGGSATSRHVLLFSAGSGELKSYLYHGSDPLSCAWHPGSRLLVTGCADGSVRIWDTASAAMPSAHKPPDSPFELPPTLDVPALDVPVKVLRDHRGPVKLVAFSDDGQWLVSLDAMGYLQIHTGFSPGGIPLLPPPALANARLPTDAAPEIPLAVEMRVNRPGQITALKVTANRIRLNRGALADELRFIPSEMPADIFIAPGLREAAWNSRGTELCAITPTDVFWLHLAPLGLAFAAPGKNPVGVGWAQADDFWILPTADQFRELRPVPTSGQWQLATGAVRGLSEAEASQGAVTALAAADDGRTAAYRARWIQFFHRHEPIAAATIRVTGSQDGVFKNIFWDAPGQLLGVTWSQTNGNLILESWLTTTNISAAHQPLVSVEIDGQQIIPANDGRHFVCRSLNRGLALFDPLSGKKSYLATSDEARQDAPMACSRDGKFLAQVINLNTIRLLTLPDGQAFADLHMANPARIIFLVWDTSGHQIASITENGYLQHWNLAPWQNWLAKHHLDP